jgi:hypothetical protein
MNSIPYPLRVVAAIGIAVLGICCVYVGTPTFALGFSGPLLALLLIGGVTFFVASKIGYGFFALSLLYVILNFFFTLEIGRSDTFRDLIGHRDVGKFSQDIAPIDISQIRIVDQAMATKIGEKLLGEEQALGSSAELGTMHIQQVSGKLYWVGPIIHSGFFAWNKFSAGTPGYIKVSATNPNDFEFVRKVGGKDLHIRYQPNAFFGDDIERHLWLNGYATTGIDDFSFEIDDEGHPFYVVTAYEWKIGWTGRDAVGIAVVEVETGKIEYFPIDKAPVWIDRIQPDNFIKEQLRWWGEYQDGWWNLSGNMKLKSAHDPLFVHGADGNGYWYTGISSKGKEGSITGFVMINSRTKAFKYYEVAGATEDSAKQSVLGKVPEKRYESSDPILYNIAGKATYVMSLKDGAGLVKMVGMADVSDHNIVGVGDTVRDALRNYLSAQNSRGNAVLSDSKSKPVQISGKVDRIGQDVRGGNTLTYFTISGKPGMAFIGDTGISPEVAITVKGDEVEIEYVTMSETGFIQISGFRNRSQGIMSGQGQKAMEATFEETRVNKAHKEDVREADSNWDKLSLKEKAKMLDSMKK